MQKFQDRVVESDPQQDMRQPQSILAAAPKSVWTFGVVLIASVIIFAALFSVLHFGWYSSLTGVWYFFLAGMGVVIILTLNQGTKMFHRAAKEGIERGTLKAKQSREWAMAEQAVAKARQANAQANVAENLGVLYEKLPQLLGEGIGRGFNIKVAQNGAFEIMSPYSNVHTIAGDGQMQQMAPALDPQLLEAGRFTVDDAVALMPYNSDKMCIGVDSNGGKPVVLSLNRIHMKVLGTSQKGKSSWIAGLITQLVQTHDRDHFQFCPLDYLHITSQLFYDTDHVLRMKNMETGQSVIVQARSVEEVGDMVLLIEKLMDHRNEMYGNRKHGQQWMDRQPRILVFIEEFLAWRKKAAVTIKPDKWARVCLAFNNLATLGLKTRITLLLAVQTAFAPPVALRDAMAQFKGLNVAFSVDPRVAQFAGFTESELIKQNAARGKFGIFVAEGDELDPGALVIAPDFDLTIALAALSVGEEEEESAEWSDTRDPMLGSNEDVSEPAPHEVINEDPDDVVEYDEPSNVSPFRVAKPQLPEPSFNDAAAVWQEMEDAGIKQSRYNMSERLTEKGFNCGENKGRKFLADIDAELKRLAQA